jgi:hypothetical protein
MKNLNYFLKIIALICLIGLFITIGLHEYHNSFNPYSWLDSNKETTESRYLWNIRKELIRLWILQFFIGTLIFSILPTLNWLISYRKIKLK